MTAFSVTGALAGGVLGVVDTLDTALGGFAGTTPSTLVFMLVGIAICAAFGAVVGLAAGVVAALVRARGITLDARRGLSIGRLEISPRVVVGALGAGTALILCAAIWWFLGDYPFGFDVGSVVIAIAVATALAFVVGIVAANRIPLARPGAWIAIGACLWYIEARVLYQFSKQAGLVPALHTIGLFGLVIFALAAVAMAAPGLWRRTARAGRPVALAVGAASIALLLCARPALSLGSNQLRLSLHERTSLTFRVLALLPAGRVDVREARRDAGCEPPRAPAAISAPAPATTRPVRGVVFIMVDSLRADHIGPELTPNIMRLAGESTSFSRAYTASPSTYRATRCMFGGCYFEDPLDVDYRRSSLGPLLSRQGIRTVAVAAHKNLWYAVYMFDVYDQFEQDISNRDSLTSQETVEHARRQLDAIGPDQRFFLVAHFYDPHAHYVPNDLFPLGRTETERYNAEVAYTDHWIGELVDDIDARGWRDDVAVVLVSDHGDEFWEHRYMRHLVRLYEESIRVAMVMRVPGGATGTVSVPVSVTDLAPTIFEMFGYQPPDSMVGTSLLAAAMGLERPANHPVFARSYYERSAAVVQGDDKLILNTANDTTEYYDLADDRAEQNNLADSAPRARYHDLYCQLTGWMASHGL